MFQWAAFFFVVTLGFFASVGIEGVILKRLLKEGGFDVCQLQYGLDFRMSSIKNVSPYEPRLGQAKEKTPKESVLKAPQSAPEVQAAWFPAHSSACLMS